MAGFRWVADFMGFDESDEAALHAAAPLLAPVVPSLVDAVYQRLFAWASVKRHFVSRQSGCEGALPSDVALLEPEHEMIQFRKRHLAGYLVALVTRPHDAAMVQMNALMGFVSDAVLQTVVSLNPDRVIEMRTLRAFNKLLWLQNHLITRQYQGLDPSRALPQGEQAQASRRRASRRRRANAEAEITAVEDGKVSLPFSSATFSNAQNSPTISPPPTVASLL